jgi:RNA polymerase sigma-70 factor (ECF subfamily)
LVRRYRKTGDARIFRSLVETTTPRVVRAVRRGCSSEADVDDVVQEVYLTVVRCLDDFDDKRCFQLWVNGIARNKVRKRQRDKARVMLPEAERVDSAEGPDETLENRELWEVVLDAVRALPACYRKVIELYYMECHSTAEIARRLGREPSTVRTQLRRGVQLLRNALPEAHYV